jgi:hypothetical protein
LRKEKLQHLKSVMILGFMKASEIARGAGILRERVVPPNMLTSGASSNNCPSAILNPTIAT